MDKREIWISDLTHTSRGISAATFPLGVSFVFSYAKKVLGNEFNFRLFKFPNHLAEALHNQSPALLCFSNYSWNFELAYKFAVLAKQKNKNIITVFGGPNFPTVEKEKINFLSKRPAIDFYTEQEGEIGFVDVVKKLMGYNFNSSNLKKNGKSILNTSYVYEKELITGQTERIKDINVIPSPYLTGALDKFFDLPLMPMIETTRGCPFTCTFCTDGLAIKNGVYRYDSERTREELYYIAKRVKNSDELVITDLNFAMYKQDLETANVIAEIQQKYNYPTIVSASSGKNLPKRVIEIAEKIKGWTIGGSVQSSDPEVLKSIKRSNISSSAYRDLITAFNEQKTPKKTHCEIILGLPGDTKEKHFESLRFGIDNNVNSMKMYQAMLLMGTEMASEESRKKFEYVTKFRTIPGCFGIYDIYDKKHSVAEIEEIIIGSKTFSVDDYLDCRVMNLMIETFYSNATFEEVYAMLRSMKVSPFDCLLYIKEHPELYSDKINKILKSFVKETTKDLYETWEEANQYVLTPDILDSYLGGELGNNELFKHKALMFNEFEDISFLMFESVKQTLKQKDLFSEKVKDYLNELKRFTKLRKENILENKKININGTFRYDFEAVRDAEYYINPNKLRKLEKPININFFQEKDQRDHLESQLKFYSTHAIGLGRLLQRANMKLIFRRFAKTVHSQI